VNALNKDEIIQAVTAAQNGENKAFESLYLEFTKSVYSLALKIMQNQEDAKDITQEVFVTVCEKLSELKEPEKFKQWLNRITANKCTDSFRKRADSISDVVYDFDEFDFIEEVSPLLIPEKALDNAETSRMIVDIIDTLPDPQRMCIYYYYYEQLTIAQIAEIFATNESTVKSRLHLARGKIRKELERLDEQEGTKLYSVAPLSLAPAINSVMQNFEMPQELVQGLWGEISATVSANAVTVGTVSTGAVLAVKTKIALAVTGVIIAGGITTGVLIAKNPAAEDVGGYISTTTVINESKLTDEPTFTPTPA